MTPLEPAIPNALPPGGGGVGKGSLIHDARQFATLVNARRYSSFVRGMRVALPTLALLTLGVILIWPGLQSRVAGVQLSFANLDSVGSELRMVSPRLTGTDREDRPYTVTAKSAIPEQNDTNRIILDAVDGDMTLADGTWINLSSPLGVYDKFLRRLELTGPVAFHTDQGFEVNARSALIDMAQGSIVTDEPVALQGPFGTLEADRSSLLERGRKVQFDGHVHGYFVQAKREGK